MSAALSHGDEGRDLVGAVRRIGDLGPVYGVVGVGVGGLVDIRLVESGTMAKYPASEVKRDPRP